MKAARRGFRNPKAASPTPILSTTSVPIKFCMIVRRQRRAACRVSTSFDRSLPIKTTSALSRATSVPEPIATPTDACISAGASFTPSPTMATLWPCSVSLFTYSNLSSGRSSEAISSTPSFQPTSSAIDFASPVSSTVLRRIDFRDRIASCASGRSVSAICRVPKNRPPRATKISEPDTAPFC